MESLRIFIERYTDLPSEEWEIIKNSFEKKEFIKDELIHTEGNICRYFYFMKEGLVRFFINNDGEDLTTYFVDAPFCFTAKESFHDRVPAKENIQALCKCVVWRTTPDEIQDLLKLHSWERFTRNLTHEVNGYIEQLMIKNKILSAEDRYLKLLETYPDLTKRVPLKYLAGFLGIAPQSLSRIRKRYATRAKLDSLTINSIEQPDSFS